MVFGTVLISLRAPECEGLVYWPAAEGFKGPVDDIIMLAFSAKKQGEQNIRGGREKGKTSRNSISAI